MTKLKTTITATITCYDYKLTRDTTVTWHVANDKLKKN